MPDFYALDRFGGNSMSSATLEHLLDDLVPLRNASHADVDRYTIEIPMRYCRCMALLKDGRKTELVNPRSFVGWAYDGSAHSYLFHGDDTFVELCRRPNGTGARVLVAGQDGIAVQMLPDDCVDVIDAPNGSIRGRKYTGIDGSLFVLS